MRHFIVLFVTISLCSCKAQNEMAAQSEQQDEDIVLIDQDNFSGILEYNNMVVKDAKSLNKFYSKINMTRKPGLPVPMVDFSKNMLIIICMGEQKDESKPILSKVEGSKDEFLISVKMPDYKNDKNSSEIVSHPFYVYKTPTTSKPVSFQKIRLKPQ